MATAKSADGTTIAFDRSGAGPALVLVGGALADRSSSRPLSARLGANFTVYIYDRRGRGSSGDAGPYSVQREIEDLATVISAAGGSACVFGHSSGAALALEAAAYGLAVTQLAVYEPPYTANANHPDPLGGLADQLSGLVTSGHRGEAVDAFLTGPVGLAPEVVERMRAGPHWAGMEALAHTIVYDLALCNRGWVPRARLAHIRIPTLALAGGDSPAWARDTAGELAATIPGAQQMVLAGQGHGAAVEVIAPILVELFLS